MLNGEVMFVPYGLERGTNGASRAVSSPFAVFAWRYPQIQNIRIVDQMFVSVRNAGVEALACSVFVDLSERV